jgi:hypothetical protein
MDTPSRTLSVLTSAPGAWEAGAREAASDPGGARCRLTKLGLLGGYQAYLRPRRFALQKGRALFP